VVEECDYVMSENEYYDAGRQLDGNLLLVKVSLHKQLRQSQTQESCFFKAKGTEKS